jgi:plastocyanin
MRPTALLPWFLAVAACSSSGTTAPPPSPPGGSQTPLNAQVAMTSPGDGYGGTSHTFNPSSVTILRTGTITWVNNSGFEHNVTFSTGGAPTNVADLSSGSAGRTFPNAGTFVYQCTNHPGMAGQVVVQ